MCSPRHARACGSSVVSRLESRFGARSQLSSRLAPSALTSHGHPLLARGSRTSFAPARDLEAREGAPVTRAPGQDGRPAEARLGALEHEELEEPAIVVRRHAPFRVVIHDVGLAAGPVAPTGHAG